MADKLRGRVAVSFLVRLPQELYERDAFDALDSGGFGIGTARALCWLSQLTYEDDNPKTDAILRLWGLRRLLSFRRPVMSLLPIVVSRGFLAEGRGFVFVAFAGTDPLATADWATDLDVNHNVDGIHRGFAAAMEAAWSQISGMLQGLTGPQSRFLITGHSLGGALAVLFAQRLKTHAVLAQGVYTFGMPRVGGPQFALEFNAALGERTYRFVHGDDIVARVPPSALGYQHVGRPIAVGRNERFDPARLAAEPSDAPEFAEELADHLREGPESPTEAPAPPGARNDAVGWLSRLLPPPIADHLPDRYRHALRPQ